MRYKVLNNVINEHKVHEMFYGHLPICAVSDATLRHGMNLEERANIARQGIDRARFLAKHDRSKYTAHIGNKQRSKHDDRRFCGLEVVKVST